MLISMFVKNFVLIDQVSLELSDGLSAFTGETGAGKSLLMDAIGVLKGDRANASMVKRGCDKAIIEGVFTIEHPKVLEKLKEDGYDLEEDDLIITREITKEGKSTARINHRIANISYIKEIVSDLVDIHSQHDTQYLLNPKYHLNLLDNFVNENALQEQVHARYQELKKVKDDLKQALSNDYNEDDLEFLTFQLNEIDQAMLQEHEVEELEEEQKRMMSYEKITSHVSQALEHLEHHSSLYEAARLLSVFEDSKLLEISQSLDDAYYQVEEMVSDLHDYVDHMEYDETRFNEIQDRIFLIHKIYRKYGGDYVQVMKKREELERKIDSILHRQDYLVKQEAIVKQAQERFLNVAGKLSKIRQKKAKELSTLVQEQLMDLQLTHARFEIAFQSIEGNRYGIDQVEFMVSMNAGEGMKPLAHSASGGELSRLMLGLKVVFTALMGIETVIFDEIDTGVSGKVAFAIGKKMQELAKQSQVFCVTHLAPVAACAKQHYMVEKHQSKDTTKTDIVLLNEEQRVKELANIASGSDSSHAIHSAKELFQLAQQE